VALAVRLLPARMAAGARVAAARDEALAAGDAGFFAFRLDTE
jgi:hypothetical protein